ncbi:imm11 family protein [Myxococcus xanthus]|uniref:Immunity MXAN-0049 protein domain-containing protein n=1 Tax=Myxococcus xanthus TaxID=34 RepID=A0A7Y4MVA9_MYXXA|nr:DUF1629 domain-containing protein [Myxococcus xanthus]NOJ83474.1 hypothetical protein [Myxococcus xanthus]NOJ87523.1 hypothetical protein [Myxococcus xanthus]
MHSFFLLSTMVDPQFCVIHEEPGSIRDTSWRISRGLRTDNHFPPDVTFQMDGEHKGRSTPDFIANTVQLAMVSSRLKELLEADSGADIEFLPISITSPQGRATKGSFFIANVLDHHDCIDMSRSEVEQLGLEPDLLSGLFRLHLLQEQIPPQAKLFRLKTMPSAIIIRDDLQTAFNAAGITGMKYIGMGERCRIY